MRIADGSLADLDELRSLWLELHHHHQRLVPEQAPFVDDAASWAARRALYQQVLAKPETVLLLAMDVDVVIGYGLAHVMSAGDKWVADTWVTGSRIGEIESLGVTGERRGQGFGTALLEQLIRRMTEIGATILCWVSCPATPL